MADDKTPRTEVIEVGIDRLVKADWNYKVEATNEQLHKLANSIEHDQSAGVLAVRERDDGRYEVMDGNHRLDALRMKKWDKVFVENFGSIPISEAILIARRRNYQWIDSDHLALSELLNREVFPDQDPASLAGFLPDTLEELEALGELAAEWEWPADWEEEPEAETTESGDEAAYSIILRSEEANRFFDVADKIIVRRELGTGEPSRLWGKVVFELVKDYDEGGEP